MPIVRVRYTDSVSSICVSNTFVASSSYSLWHLYLIVSWRVFGRGPRSVDVTKHNVFKLNGAYPCTNRAFLRPFTPECVRRIFTIVTFVPLLCVWGVSVVVCRLCVGTITSERDLGSTWNLYHFFGIRLSLKMSQIGPAVSEICNFSWNRLRLRMSNIAFASLFFQIIKKCFSYFMAIRQTFVWR